MFCLFVFYQMNIFDFQGANVILTADSSVQGEVCFGWCSRQEVQLTQEKKAETKQQGKRIKI